MIPSPTLTRALAGSLCSGCGLCAGIGGGAVTMRDVAPGYLRPQQTASLDAAQEAAIASACPAVIVDERPEHAAPHYDPLWGPWTSCSTGYSTDAEVRHLASSGGMISGVLMHALATGQIDFVVQTGADPAAPLANETRASTDAAAILSAAGSRYTASAPLAELDRWLAMPGKFAFVGKPCDVTALRALARTDARIDAKVPIMLAFFCGGIPSAAGTRRILAKIEAPEAEVTAFRYRGDGWPGYATATLKDGTTRRMSYAASWGDILAKELQFRCKICPDAVGGSADIAAADAWYGDERGYPSFEEQDGRSLVVARTAAGQALLDGAVAAGVVETAPLDVGEIIKMQPAQALRKRQILSRIAALAVVGRAKPRYRGVGLWAAAAREAPLGHAHSFTGMLRRVFQGRI